MDCCKAIVRQVILTGSHGPFAIATAVNRPDIAGSITFSLEPTVWDHGKTMPTVGDEVLVGKLRFKRRGWRSKEARFWEPCYEQRRT